MICPTCNFQNEETAKFCRNCGVKLEASQPQPEITPTPPTYKQKSNTTAWVLFVMALVACAILGTLLLTTNNKSDVTVSPPDKPTTQGDNAGKNEINRDGITINGVTWAKKNLGAFDPEDYGNYYTWEEAKNACPKGWRLPTKEEFESLVNAGSVWTTQNGKKGRKFGDSNNYIFLPATGLRYLSDGTLSYAGSIGIYWSSSVLGTDSYSLYFHSDDVYPSINYSREDGLSCRCVAE